MNANNLVSARAAMVQHQIVSRGVRDGRVLEAMRKVPREAFVPANVREFAYDDCPLPIAAEQTISQPYIVAFMVEALGLNGGEKVLEIGAGSGYAAAVLAEIAEEVFTVERIEQLAHIAAKNLESLGYGNVHVVHDDGTCGLPEQAPFDAIIVAAGSPRVPHSLKLQLKLGGRLVIPVGCTKNSQHLVKVTRVSEKKYLKESIGDVRFVPLIGKEAWQERTETKVPPKAK